jgi:ferredoxin--NADP+ reductase
VTAESEIPWNARVLRRLDPSDHVRILWIAPDSGGVQPFEPGQFVQVGWPKDRDPDAPTDRVRWIKRSYSIASSPQQREAYELFLAVVPGGLLTPRLFHLAEGDRVWCDDAPKGHFTLARVPAGQHVVAFATGTGIAPFVSMLRRYRGTDRWRKLTIVWGSRASADLVYDAELRAAAADDPSVRYVPVLSREPASGTWSGLRGHVQVVLEDRVFREAVGEPLVAEGTHALLCGNPAMIEDARGLLEARGFRLDTIQVPGNLHYERYW